MNNRGYRRLQLSGRVASFLSVILVVSLWVPISGDATKATASPTTSQKSASQKSAPKNAVTKNAAAKPAAAEPPADVETAAAILDLRKLPLPEKIENFSTPEVGALSYNAKTDPAAAFKYHQQQLLQLGWKELPGTAVTEQYASGMFSKAGYTVALMASPNGESGKDLKCLVSLTNLGNVSLKDLPVIDGVKSTFINEATAMYSAAATVPEATEKTLKLLLSAGWEPYGFIDSSPELKQFAVKQNAVRIFVMVSVAPAQNNATSIMYSSSLLAADIPAPPDAQELQFQGSTKTLLFRSPQEFEDVAKFYQETLSKKGWKPTTETLVSSLDDFDRPVAFQVFRNEAGDMLTLDVEKVDDRTSAKVVHLTNVEFEEAEKRAREAALASVAGDKEKMDPTDESEMEINALADAALGEALKSLNGGKGGKKSKKSSADGVSLEIPAGAKSRQTSDNVIQLNVSAGKGSATAKLIVDQLKKAGWKLEDEESDESSGNLQLTKGNAMVTLTFVDTGITDVNMMIIGVGTPIRIAESAETSTADGNKKPDARKSPAGKK